MSGSTPLADGPLYDKGTGGLFYDADGSGSAATAVQFAVIDTKVTLSHHDFFVV
ncbi:hypothetical protein [Methylobacterium sp. Leaf399]|uniref:hypothetical protein n=1 Tax=Methylobacterium sp. Leaf399 TaxID=1736364 RepID=UPI000A96842F|nr:hypothetical protein [Methylobacterium sp. Leaf399]